MNFSGSNINGYKFIEVVGSGSFGTVYKVEKDGKIYAAKVFSESFVLKEYKADRNRITNEIDALKIVDSDNLVKYYDDFDYVLESGLKTHIIIMEFVTGKKLTDIIDDIDNDDQLVNLFKDILNAVKQLHSYGIIHRDLKPDNILMTDDGIIKVIDYGLVKLIDFSSITRTGDNIGSPMFMAPEQIVDSKHITTKSDIYSLGVILYLMFTKSYPYDVTSLEELIYKIINVPIVPPSEKNNNIPIYIEKIIYKSLSKKDYNRYQTIDEFYKSFDDITNANDITPSTYYAWLINEKKVYETYKESKNLKCIFPLHLKYSQKGLYNYMLNNKDDVIIDPSTQRFSYATFSNVTGLVNLAYSPKTGVMDLDYLIQKNNREEYIRNWYNEISEFNKVILPYHYISNTNYKADKIEEWIKVNIQLINESIDYIEETGKKLETYAMISINLNNLMYEKERLLSYYVNLKVDKYIVQISDMKNPNVQNLATYVEFIKTLQISSGKDVIALKIPVALGLYLISIGVHGFSCGISNLEFFDENYIKDENDPFNLYAKYYFPHLLTLMSYYRSDAYSLQDIYNELNKCDCSYCDGRDFVEIAAEKDYKIKLHFLEQMEKELKKLNDIIDENEKKCYYVNRIEEAISNFESLRNSGLIKKSDINDILSILKRI
ncbi:MAG: serine/threonine protein kinase [Bacilli bacterium]|nr:serine/threonine protein kinase [Bacilli bacterium]